MNNLNCIQTNTFEFYNSYHKHPVNKFFHLLGIPIITLTTLILIRDFYFGYSDILKLLSHNMPLN